MAGLGFQANQYNPTAGFEPLPAGDYTSMIVEAEVKSTRAGNGHYVKFTWTVMDGAFAGRKLWSQHNIINPNQTAEQIGREEISAIAHGIGAPEADDTDLFLNKPCRITVSIRQETGRDPQNVIRKWQALNNGQPVAPASQASQDHYNHQPPPMSQPSAPHQSTPQQPPMSPAGSPPWK